MTKDIADVIPSKAVEQLERGVGPGHLIIVNGPPGLGHRHATYAWAATAYPKSVLVPNLDESADLEDLIRSAEDATLPDGLLVLSFEADQIPDLDALGTLAHDHKRCCVVVLAAPRWPHIPAGAYPVYAGAFRLDEGELEQMLARYPESAAADVTGLHAATNGWPGHVADLLRYVATGHAPSVDLEIRRVDERLRRLTLPALPEEWLPPMRYLALAGEVKAHGLQQVTPWEDPTLHMAHHGLLTSRVDDTYGDLFSLPEKLRSLLLDPAAFPLNEQDEMLRTIHEVRVTHGIQDCGLAAAYTLKDWERCATTLHRWPLRTEYSQFRPLAGRVLAELPEDVLRRYPTVAMRAAAIGLWPLDTASVSIPKAPDDIRAFLAAGRLPTLMHQTRVAIGALRKDGRIKEAMDISQRTGHVARTGQGPTRERILNQATIWCAQAGLSFHLGGQDAIAGRFYQAGWMYRDYSEVPFAAADVATKAAVLAAIGGDMPAVTRWLDAYDAIPEGAEWPDVVARTARLANAYVRWEDGDFEPHNAGSLVPHLFADDENWPFLLMLVGMMLLEAGEAERLIEVADEVQRVQFRTAKSDGIHQHLLQSARAEAYLVLGQGNRALAAMGDEVAASTVFGATGVRWSLATGQYDVAAARAEAMLAARGLPPRRRNRVRVLRAVALARLGRTDEAREALRSAIEDSDRHGLRRLGSAMDVENREFITDVLPDEAAALTGRSIARASLDVTELTDRETVILKLLAQGLTLPTIAAAEYVSLNTVKTQARSLYRKLGAGSRAEAVAAGQRLGLVAPGP
ncbi:hypothetical protein Back2_00300 [Nocardioides baekrokdamisoli]|uniref:HTH luxR-type domain-containing protein n=1 Tax=Nocardioides baekrokdamisoli TaxID=1804624 RepID=A0A3G9IU84_9ACTN|nr:LuxR C-terminal-related transcriptional regulator [Nocardioides baekrokdamisoli]BBH15743.1 hypothetical protein Back2_00300 [Nocardioides baekrokdamisoli]